MKQLLAAIALMGFVASASATSFTGATYQASTDDTGWTFDGTSIIKLYSGAESNFQSSGQQTLAIFSFDIAPDPGHVISAITISISGLLNASPTGNSPYADVGLLATSTLNGLFLFHSVPFNTLADGWPAPASFTASYTHSVTGTLPGEITFFVDTYATVINASAYARLDSFALQVVTAPVPEPSGYALLGIGLGVMGVVARRRKNQSSV